MSRLDAFTQQGGQFVATSSGGAVEFSRILLSPGGEYRICWCAFSDECKAERGSGSDVGKRDAPTTFLGAVLCSAEMPVRASTMWPRDVDLPPRAAGGRLLPAPSLWCAIELSCMRVPPWSRLLQRKLTPSSAGRVW